MSSSYRFAGAFVVRWTGIALVALALLVLAMVVVSAALSVPARLVGVVVLVALVLWVALLAGLLVLRRAVVVRLDETGYRVRLVRGAGVREAVWRDVEDAAASTVAGHRCVVLRLRDGRSTTIPVDVLAGSSDGFVRDLQQHLNEGHGYRSLPRT